MLPLVAQPPGKPKNNGVGSLSLLQGIFLTHKSNRCLLHCRQILYQLGYQGSSTISLSLLKLMFIESMMPSKYLILFCSLLCPQSFPASGSFPMSQLLPSGGQSVGASASSSVLPMNISDYFPLGLNGSYSLQSQGLTCESESCSVMSDSLQPHGLYSPGILQARKLEWVAFPFSRGSSQPTDRTQVSHIAGRFFTS